MRPGPSGEDLCVRVGGLRSWGAAPGGDLGAWLGLEARVCVWVTVGVGRVMSWESTLVNPLRTEARLLQRPVWGS